MARGRAVAAGSGLASNLLVIVADYIADELARDVLVKNVSAPGALANCLRITIGTALDNERWVRALRPSLMASRAIATG